ncbi:MAG: hypothetical protein GF331_12565 [Chitinivibrionales bacterium]|nr:hypothetical protein [Chitinivibrionales bacterium]
MRASLLVFIVLVQGVCFAQERFVLESELRTNFSSGGSVSSFTAYHYDTEGNRVERRVFDGVDSAAALMSSVRYSYDTQGRCVEELLVDDAGDTLSMVRYAWGAEGVLRATTLDSDGSVRFADSLRYAGGLLRAQERYDAAGELAWYRNYGYERGSAASDSLYEPDGVGGFSATQARLLSRNTDSTVAAEAQWRLAGGAWYLISTTVMSYADKELVSATTYEGDGATLRLMDSLAYAVDSYGNRTLEEHFDDERTKTYEIAYTWRDTQQGVAIAPVAAAARSSMAWRNGRVEFGRPVSGCFVLCRIDGRRVRERRLASEESVTLSAGLSVGRYIALVRGTLNESLSITIHN